MFRLLTMKAFIFLPALALSSHAGEASAPSELLTPVSKNSSDWEFTSALYAPLMGLEGNIGVIGLGPFEADVPFDEILENLDGAFSGAFQARHGSWSFTIDAIWLKLSASGDPLANSRFTMSQEQFTTSLSTGYEIYETGFTQVDFVAGAVLNSLDVDLKLFTPALPVTFSKASGTQTWVDPFFGLRFHHSLDDCWSVFTNGTVGGFGVSSDEYWQVLAGVGYRLGENTSLALAYRMISVDYRQGGFVYDTVSSGPNIGLILRF